MGVLYWGIAGVQRQIGTALLAVFRGFQIAAAEGISAAVDRYQEIEMQIVKVPAAGNIARLTISPLRFGDARVNAVMTITSAMQSNSDRREFASTEEAERAGIDWARNHRADVLVIEGGAN